MHGVARNFFILAIAYALCGMALGLQMSITHDHTQMPVHAHTMVAGWLMSAVFAFFYHLVPAAAASRLAPVHLWLTAASGSCTSPAAAKPWAKLPQLRRGRLTPRSASSAISRR